MRGNVEPSYEELGFPIPFASLVAEVAKHEVWLHGRSQKFAIEALASGCGELEAKTTQVDRFIIKWHHSNAGPITWWVIFDASRPQMPPDFIFHDTDFVPSMSALPSLVQWNPNDPKALTKVLDELFVALVLYELEKLPERVRREYASLMEKNHISPKHCSACVTAGTGDLAQFWIRLVFDNDPLFFADFNYTVGVVGRLGNVPPEVTMSPPLQDAVGQFVCPTAPNLASAVERLYNLISGRLLSEKEALHKRRELFTSVLTLQGESLLEVDIAMFRRLDLLVQHSNVYSQVTLRLPAGYPVLSKQIELVAKSVYSDKDPTYKEEILVKDEEPLLIAHKIYKCTDQLGERIAKDFGAGSV